MSRCLFAVAALSSLTLACQSSAPMPAVTPGPATGHTTDQAGPAPVPATSGKRLPFAERTPRVGERAPTLKLPQLDGQPVELAAAYAQGPTVLVFGSYT